MEVRVHEDLREFWEITSPLYLADPLRHTVILTVTRRSLDAPDPAEEPPVLLTLWDGDRFAGATVRTPPWPVAVSGLPESAIEPAAKALLEVAHRCRWKARLQERSDELRETLGRRRPKPPVRCGAH